MMHCLVQLLPLLLFCFFQREARGSVTFKIVPSYRSAPPPCEVQVSPTFIFQFSARRALLEPLFSVCFLNSLDSNKCVLLLSGYLFFFFLFICFSFYFTWSIITSQLDRCYHEQNKKKKKNTTDLFIIYNFLINFLLIF